MKEQFTQNSAIFAGSGIAVVSPELMISIAGILIALAGFVWKVISDKQSEAERKEEAKRDLEEKIRHNKAIEEIEKLKLDKKL